MNGSFEKPSESIEQLLAMLAERLKDIPEATYELRRGVTVEISKEGITLYQEFSGGQMLVENLVLTGDYDSYLAGTGDIEDEDLELIEKIEAERGISFNDPELTFGILKHILELLENINVS